ncbi:MAG: DUF481 domain-containing protein [Desulfuromonadales bacterium]
MAFVLVAVMCNAGAASAAEGQDRSAAGRWWETGSLTDGMADDRFLVHSAGRFSYDEADGNITGKEYDISAPLIIRYWRLTNHFEYRLQLAEQELEGGRGDFSEEVETISEELRLDLFKYLYAVAGYIRTKDDVRFIDKRHTWFGGLGSNFTLGESHVIGVAAYYGYEKMRYTLDIEDFESPGWMFQQSWKWQIVPAVRFIQDAFYLGFSEDANRYRWRLGYGFEFPLGEKFAMLVTREVLWDNQPVGVAKRKDTGLSVGFRFAF